MISNIYKGPVRLKEIPPPSLPARYDDEIEKAQQTIKANPNLYNGQKLFCQSFQAGEIRFYQADYALRLAMQNISGSHDLGLGTLWCGTILHNRQGRLLLARRAEHLAVEPGSWFISAAGGIDPGEEPEQAAARETLEELGLGVSLEYLSTIVGQPPYGVGVLYHALVDQDTAPQLAAEELVEWGWFEAQNLPFPQANLLQQATRLLAS